MDGTLTQPVLDFDRMREEIGITSEPLLEAIASLSDADRARAEAVLHRHEHEAAVTSELQPFACEVLEVLRRLEIPLALMTRNTRASVTSVQQRHDLRFDLIRTREDGVCKPSPQPVFEICCRFSVEPKDAWVVGDYHYDVLCGVAAGCTTALLLDAAATRPTWAGEAHIVIYSLKELLVHMDVHDLELA